MQPVQMGGQLTSRETEVLQLIARGLSNAEISDILAIAEQTTKTHVGRILAKPSLRDRTQAVVLASKPVSSRLANDASPYFAEDAAAGNSPGANDTARHPVMPGLFSGLFQRALIRLAPAASYKRDLQNP